MIFFIYIALFIFFSFLLIKATDILIGSLRSLILATGIGAFGAASFILAFSTSLPELLVGISAALQGESILSLGNVIGSNIANLSLVVGGAAALSGILPATSNFLRKDVFYVFLAGSFPLLLLLDGRLTKLDGLILLVVYVIYNMSVLERKREKLAEKSMEEEPVWRRILVRLNHKGFERSVGHLAVGVLLLVISADMIVRIATEIAHLAGIPVILVGLFIVAVGTSLPELAFEIAAIRKRQVQMAFGNILGSVVTNSTLILGVTVLISPITVIYESQAYLIASLIFIAVFLLFWWFVWTKKRLDRWEGAALVIFYLLSVWIEFLRLNGSLAF